MSAETESCYEITVGSKNPARAHKDVRIFDYKDGASRITVAGRDDDPSRIWIGFENEASFLRVSLEEGRARHLLIELDRAFSLFVDSRRARAGAARRRRWR